MTEKDRKELQQCCTTISAFVDRLWDLDKDMRVIGSEAHRMKKLVVELAKKYEESNDNA
jgi:hypothetical protein